MKNLLIVFALLFSSMCFAGRTSPCYSNGGHGHKLVYGHEKMRHSHWSTPYADHYKRRK